MKTLVFVSLFLIPAFFNAQKVKKENVPPAVVSAFISDHPNVKVDEWEKENGNFEAEFKIHGKEHSMVYDAQGKLVESEEEIAPDDLPDVARQYIVSNYRKSKIKEAARITSASGIVTYEADLGTQDLLFDNSGKFITIEKESADDKD
jgi:hypothetical protein